MIPQDRLKSVIARHAAITEALTRTQDTEDIVRLSRELAGIDEVAAKAKALQEADAELADAQSLLDDADIDMGEQR